MRGKIIHYNASDGKGLVAATGQQFAFQIGQWRSDSAPAVNQTVELQFGEDGTLQSLAKVGDEVLLREKASELAGRLGGVGGAALGTLKANSPGTAEGLQGGITRLGKPVLGLYAVFAVSALLLPYLKIRHPFGGEGRSFSLVGLSDLSQQLGTSVGGSFLPWLAILACALPLFWRSRIAWLALLLPLLATLKPFWDVAWAIRKVTQQASQFDARIGNAIAGRLLDTLGTGVGLWLCLLTALALAAFGLKRTVLPPTDTATPQE